MKTIVIKNTKAGRRAAAAELERVQAGALTRTVDLTDEDWRELCQKARADGYASEHGGGVANSYRGAAASSAVLVTPLGARRYVVTVGRGRAPSGPRGNVGPSVTSMLGCPWLHAGGRAARLQLWGAARCSPKVEAEALGAVIARQVTPDPVLVARRVALDEELALTTTAEA